MADELKPWPLGGYAPGGYICKCEDCGERFDGDKRAFQCLPCASKWIKTLARRGAAAGDLLEALKGLREELRLIRMKDSDAVYDVMCRTNANLAIARFEALTTQEKDKDNG